MISHPIGFIVCILLLGLLLSEGASPRGAKRQRLSRLDAKLLRKNRMSALHSFVKNWTKYEAMTRQSRRLRKRELNPILSLYPGVYARAPVPDNLANTVVVIVFVVQDQTKPPNFGILNNMLSHMKKHQISALIYVSRAVFSLAKEHIVYGHAHLVPYPDSLFWNKLIRIAQPIGAALPKSALLPYPNFEEYGDRVVLLPLFELLEMGKHVLLLDYDVVLLRDPIPFLSLGRDDIVSTVETRRCSFESPALTSILDGQSMREMNIGITFIRSRPETRELVEKWLVSTAFNGQKSFPYRSTRRSNDCNPLKMSSHNEKLMESSTSTEAGVPTLCYLSDILFQNGFTNGPQCGSLNKNPYYLIALAEQVYAHFSKDRNLLSCRLDRGSPSLELYSDVKLCQTLNTPVSVHANYIGMPKEIFLKKSGLWMLESDESGLPEKCQGPFLSSSFTSTLLMNALQLRWEFISSVNKNFVLENSKISVSIDTCSAISSPVLFFNATGGVFELLDTNCARESQDHVLWLLYKKSGVAMASYDPVRQMLHILPIKTLNTSSLLPLTFPVQKMFSLIRDEVRFGA